ncbi:MAG TPA: hypothetical protein VHE35_17835 [Kofleriaceae bacterium]|nr:hypothetical protein [Kofleriaceae bacterium]
MRALALSLSLLVLASCDSHLEAKVGGATLPQALGVVPAAKAPVVVVLPGQAPAALPAGPVRLAIDLHTPWAQVRPLLDGAAATGSQPILLVGQRDALHGFVLDDPRGHDPELQVSASAQGKFCLWPPDAPDEYCVESSDHRHISAAFVREAVEKAVKEYGLTHVRVHPTDDVAWGDLVRAVDGTRTCCKEPVQVTVTR